MAALSPLQLSLDRYTGDVFVFFSLIPEFVVVGAGANHFYFTGILCSILLTFLELLRNLWADDCVPIPSSSFGAPC